jgi:hypothetical protein
MRNIIFGNRPEFGVLTKQHLDSSRILAEVGDLGATDFDHFDYIIPCRSAEYTALDRRGDLNGVKFWRPAPDVVALCEDKYELNRFLIEHRFEGLIPSLVEPGDGTYPYIVKRRAGEDGDNSHLIRNAFEEKLLSHVTKSAENFCQAYIPGNTEFELHVLFAKGRLHYAQTIKYTMKTDFYVRSQFTPVSDVLYCADNHHLDYFLPILEWIGYDGICCLNYKMLDGVPRLFKISPRLENTLTGDLARLVDAYIRSLETRSTWSPRRVVIEGSELRLAV